MITDIINAIFNLSLVGIVVFCIWFAFASYSAVQEIKQDVKDIKQDVKEIKQYVMFKRGQKEDDEEFVDANPND